MADRSRLTEAQARRVLGVAPDADHEAVRQAYRALIRAHHPDRPGVTSDERATLIIEAHRVLTGSQAPAPEGAATTPPPGPTVPPRPASGARRTEGAPPVVRTADDSLLVVAPADEAFRWLVEAAHDIGDITYVDRSMPILEVLCRFEGEPATSLLATLQGRGNGTEVLCTVESIEARPAPPTGAVVDLLELALHRRRPTVG